MKRSEYKNYTWYQVTDENYWVNDEKEFPYCQTIVAQMAKPGYSVYIDNILTIENCPYGWGTMAKAENFYFMIIELPH